MSRAVPICFVAILAAVACGGSPPLRQEPAPPPRHELVPPHVEQHEHPCDDFTEVRVSVKTEGDAVVFQKTTTDGHCSTPRTTVTELGRVRATKTATCPIGELAYRVWSAGHGFRAELPDVDRTLPLGARANLRQALAERSVDGVVTAYVLGCGASTDFVVVRERETRIEFWAGNKMAPTDPRFVTP